MLAAADDLRGLRAQASPPETLADSRPDGRDRIPTTDPGALLTGTAEP